MSTPVRLSAILLLAALAGCGGPAPQAAQFVPPEPGVAELEGPLLARYTLVPTLALDAAMARRYGIAREEGSAMLLVALRRPGPDGEEAAEGQVQARVRDLSGRVQEVALRRIDSDGYHDHVGVVAVAPRDELRVEVQVQADGRRQRFGFQRRF